MKPTPLVDWPDRLVVPLLLTELDPNVVSRMPDPEVLVPEMLKVAPPLAANVLPANSVVPAADPEVPLIARLPLDADIVLVSKPTPAVPVEEPDSMTEPEVVREDRWLSSRPLLSVFTLAVVPAMPSTPAPVLTRELALENSTPRYEVLVPVMLRAPPASVMVFEP
jgi:hypothetical protein